jgi:GT2 family glycosyltransferase
MMVDPEMNARTSEDQPITLAGEAGDLFDANYFQSGLGLPYERSTHWLNFFGGIADEIIRSLKPRTVFDAGCALGFLVEALWDRGVESSGVDISSFAISQVRRDIQPYCRQDSLVNPIKGRYDLVTCIEVLEHLQPQETADAIANLAAASDTILFSSSPTDLTEATHFNVRPVIGWLKLFEAAGFWPDCTFDASFLAPHAMLLRKQPPPSEDVLALFSEKTRLKCALVEREQRIGGLNQKIADLTRSLGEKAGLLAELDRAGEIETLRAENSRLSGELQLLHNEHSRISIELLTIQQQQVGSLGDIEMMRLQNRGVASHFQRLRDENKRVSGELQRLRHENEQLSETLRISDRENSDRLSEIEEFLNKTLSLQTDLTVSKNELVRLREEVAHINRSAAWQLTTRYRNWVETRRERSSWVRLYDRTAKWLIRSVKDSPLEPPAPEAANTPQTVDEVTLVAKPQIDEPVQTTLQAVSPKAESYESWYTRTEPGPKRLELQRALSLNLRLQPLLTVLVPVYNVPLRVLEEMVDSVRSQSYPHWELCLAHGYPLDVEGREFLAAVAAEDTRIKLKLLEANEGISGNSNAALQLVQGEFVVLLDHDDTLAPFALFQIATAINEHPEAGFLYSDKDCITEDSQRRIRPLFKPQWSPDTMLSANYLTHLSVIRTDLVRAAGGWKSETDGAQDWDIFLRIIDSGAKVVHVPGVLYHWRIISTSVASGIDAKPYVTHAQIATLNAHAERRASAANTTIDYRGVCKMNWNKAEEHSVSIILVPSSSDSDLLPAWVQRIDSGTEWPRVEIVASCLNNAESNGRIRYVSLQPDDSLATWLNRAVQASSGEYLVVLDKTVDVGQPDWLKELVGPMQQSEVVVVGPKVLDPVDNVLRHAGLVFNTDGTLDYIFSQEPEHICEQFGAAIWYRDWSAVAGACFAVRRKSFETAGGFHENPAYPRHDVDLCLRIKTQTGGRIVYNPFARFFQSRTSTLESWLSPDGPRLGSAYIRECLASGDPYFHRDLESRSGKVLFASNRLDTRTNDYAAESRALVGAFDAHPDLVESSKAKMPGARTNSLQRITWILPQFVHPFYGGVHTIFRFADYFRRSHGVDSEFVYLGGVPEQLMKDRLATAFPCLATSSRAVTLRSYGDWDRVTASDATISTLWTTAYSALHFQSTRGKFYFVQDYESSFYPAGSTYGLVEATYRFGYYGICNTRPLAEMYREFGGEAEYFDPCIDPRYFFEPSGGRHDSKPFRIFCYARPGHPRNCFELLSDALCKLKQRLGDQVEILSAGSEWNPADYGLKGVVENLGLLGYSATGALYRTCDAGVVLMMTRHPSYLPMELMACGSLVITNENRYTRWLLEHEKNCLLSDTTSSAVASTIERGLVDKDLRARIAREAREQIRARHSDWDLESEKIYRYMVANV